MDKQILEILEQDARASFEEIALRLGTTPEKVAEAVDRLKSARVILKYNTMIDWEKIGEEKVFAFIDVQAAPEHGVGFDGIAQHIMRFPEVHSLYLMSGAYDLSVVVEGRSFRDIALFVAEKLSPLPQVRGTATHFVLKRYKLDGINLVEEPTDKRLAVTP